MTDINTAPYGAFVLRVSLGVMSLAHAGLKIFVFTLAGTAGYFESLGLPGFTAYLITLLEALAGIALIVGFQSRFAALSLIPVLIGSILFAHGDKGWLFSNEGGGWEYSAFLIGASAAVALLGDGAFALRDRFKLQAA